MNQIPLINEQKKASNTNFDTNSHRDIDVKRPGLTSNDLKRTSKNKKNKLKGGDPSDSQNDGKNLIEQAFSSN